MGAVAGSSVYGPVESWRVGRSLGVDLLLVDSICSFNCVYCQLGEIRVRTNQRQVFVPTERLLRDLREADWASADIITFSGSGEPTLAANLGEAIREVKRLTGKPVLVLTNGSQLPDPKARRELARADRVYIKLDAGSQEIFERINRPADGLRLEEIVRGAEDFRREYEGLLGVQIMFLGSNVSEVEEIADLLERISPDEVQVNTPLRPRPAQWRLESRGGLKKGDCPARRVKPISPELAESLAEGLREATGLGVVCVYDRPHRG